MSDVTPPVEQAKGPGCAIGCVLFFLLLGTAGMVYLFLTARPS
jgi:hypothetical protein